jgi:hypothetical protein
LYLRRVRFQPDQWKRPVAVEPGERVDEYRARALARRVQQQLVDRGYWEARVDAELKPVDVHQADLVLRVEPGSQKPVRFSGDLGLDERKLRKVLRWDGLETDLARLRRLYLSRGYSQAWVRASRAEKEVEIQVQAGPRGEPRPHVCGGLRAARRLAWDPESEWTVGRIEFRGHHRFGDAVWRRAFLLEEGAPFDRRLLGRSLRRLEPLGHAEVREHWDLRAREVRLVVTVLERKRGKWAVDGPLSPWGRPSARVQFEIGPRLYAGVGWSGGPRLFVQSGEFYWSPQGGWMETVGIFAQARLWRALGLGRRRAEECIVPVDGRQDPVLCEVR